MARRVQPLQAMRRGARRLGAAVLLALAAGPASACLVCIDLPDETLTDRVWAAETVVLARNHPADPFSYRVVETIAGGTDAPVTLLVNTAERRRMAADPDRRALLLRGADGWRLGGHGGAELAALARRMHAMEADWSDERDDPDRIRAFAALHADPDPLIRRLALTELARAPYARLRGIEVALAPEWLAARIAEPSWYGWQPILAVMLGLHADPAAREIVVGRALQARPEDRAPWLVALVEADGAVAIDRILAAAHGPADARAAIRAFVVHTGAGAVGAEALAAALTRLASEHPALAAEAAPGLSALRDFSLAPMVADAFARGAVSDPAEAFVLRLYLAQARAAREDAARLATMARDGG
jgi:hypothetical protein